MKTFLKGDKKMEKIDEQEKKAKKGGIKELIARIKESVNSTVEEIRSNSRSLIQDLMIFTVGFLLSRCQLILGARPIGIAFVAMLPTGVWPALLGVAIGSGSLGADGIIFAVAAVVTALLRMAASISEKRERCEGTLFGESLLLRIAVSVLSGFIVAVYEALMRGLNEATLLFGLTMIILTPLLTFLLSGLCSTGIDFWEVIEGSKDLLKLSECEKNERYDRIFFQISSLALITFISLSFKNVNILGISLSYVFTALMTLTVAKRFGALRAMAVGFISSLIISGELSVAFALAGLCSGVMMSFGSGYGIVAGGVALCAWSAYAVGLNGLLATLPEYIIASALALPLLKKVGEITDTEETEEHHESSEDMVGTMALAYQNEYSGSIDSLEPTLSSLAGVINKYTSTPIRLTAEEYRDIVIGKAKAICTNCKEGGICTVNGIRPVIKNADRICQTLCEGEKASAEHINADGHFCFMANRVAEEINRTVGCREQERYMLTGAGNTADEYSMMARLIGQSRQSDINERMVDNSMTAALTSAFESCGFKNGTIRVFGNHRRHFILAGEDESGSRISSFELRKSIEEAAGVKLSIPEYFRRGKMVLMECGIRPSYKVSFATATKAGNKDEVSGDTAICFESEHSYFYSLISDGMGSGSLARETSGLVCEFIKQAMNIGSAKETLLHMLNHVIRDRREECSATVDLFELDMLRGGGVFIKSGATPSYVKRDSSIFRIRSQTAPIGLMRSIDTERINVEIKGGDHIFMFSDGIAEIAEDAPWLLLLLGEPVKKDLKEYADVILKEAEKNGSSSDDMTVTVIRVDEV